MLNLANVGNSAAIGTSIVRIFASSDQMLDGTGTQIASFRARLNIKPSRSRVYRFNLKTKASVLQAGNVYLIAQVGAAGLIPVTTVVAPSQTAVS